MTQTKAESALPHQPYLAEWDAQIVRLQSEIVTLRAINDELVAEVEEWRSCAKYDAMMDGPRFKAWDRSHMDRCRKRFIDAVSARARGEG